MKNVDDGDVVMLYQLNVMFTNEHVSTFPSAYVTIIPCAV
jgi:hypothetical protein